MAGETGPAGEAGAAGIAGKDGVDGKDAVGGITVDDLDESMAVGAAMSMPVWLEPSENFAVSGGLGFSEGGATAIGATGVARIDKSISAFVGGAVSTNGQHWVGKAGVRIGW